MKLADLRFQPKSDWAATPVSKLPDWPEHGRVGIDTETHDEHLKQFGIGVRRGGYVSGISFAIDGGPGHYLPIRHEGGGNLDTAQVKAYMAHQASRFKGELVGANMGYDLEYLHAEGVKFNSVRRFRDVQVIEPLLDELQLSYSLQSILERHGLAGKNENLLREAAEYFGIDPKADLWRLPARHVGPYAIADAAQPLALLRRQEAEIQRQGLDEVYDWECRLVPVLVKMRQRGVRVDLERLRQVEVWSAAKEAEALAEIKRTTGYGFALGEITKGSAVLPMLKEAGIPILRTDPTEKFPEGQESVTAPWLESLTHPLGDLIRSARRYSKLRTTFCASAREHQVDGRIHCSLRQTRVHVEGRDEEAGARFGRLSCTDPNLQQQPSPSRDLEMGTIWRSIYVPDEGAEWLCMDLSQQEPRWAVHFAAKLRCRGADELLKTYQASPETDMYDMLSAMSGEKRGLCKTILLGKIYGMGQGKLCDKLGLPVRTIKRHGKDMLIAGEEGQKVLAFFDTKFPFMKELAECASQAAQGRGYVWTAGKRKCRFPRTKKGYDWVFKALNRVVQGSSGDQVKRAMVLADDDGIPLQLQVHDELDLSIWDRGIVGRLREIMLSALPCDVPHKVDPQIGPNWGNLTKFTV